MKILVQMRNHKVIYCQKRDIFTLIKFGEDIPESILSKFMNFEIDDEEFLMFTEPEEVRFLQKSNIIISFNEIYPQNNLEDYYFYLRTSLNNLQTRQKETNINSEAHSFLEKTIKVIKHKISSIDEYKKGIVEYPAEIVPILSGLTDGNHTVIGALNKQTLIIKRNDGEPLDINEKINIQFIAEIIKLSLGIDNYYPNNDSCSYIIIPDYQLNNAAIIIKEKSIVNALNQEKIVYTALIDPRKNKKKNLKVLNKILKVFKNK